MSISFGNLVGAAVTGTGGYLRGQNSGRDVAYDRAQKNSDTEWERERIRQQDEANAQTRDLMAKHIMAQTDYYNAQADRERRSPGIGASGDASLGWANFGLRQQENTQRQAQRAITNADRGRSISIQLNQRRLRRPGSFLGTPMPLTSADSAFNAPIQKAITDSSEVLGQPPGTLPPDQGDAPTPSPASSALPGVSWDGMVNMGVSKILPEQRATQLYQQLGDPDKVREQMAKEGYSVK